MESAQARINNFATKLEAAQWEVSSATAALTSAQVQYEKDYRAWEVYVNLGHSDLAKCVQEGKFYQRLNILLGHHPELSHLKALREIVTGDKIFFANDGEYKDWCLTRYGEDEGYLRLLRNTIA
ncbi:hypothetical protein I204_04132 [Kwoniella mangroviensis CBS 8886]|nr:hypothetical protein I204_04132 [Kwoniella mangroviensis CBS 8886]